jgi:hypothetical protein
LVRIWPVEPRTTSAWLTASIERACWSYIANRRATAGASTSSARTAMSLDQ